MGFVNPLISTALKIIRYEECINIQGYKSCIFLAHISNEIAHVRQLNFPKFYKCNINIFHSYTYNQHVTIYKHCIVQSTKRSTHPACERPLKVHLHREQCYVYAWYTLNIYIYVYIYIAFHRQIVRPMCIYCFLYALNFIITVYAVFIFLMDFIPTYRNGCISLSSIRQNRLTYLHVLSYIYVCIVQCNNKQIILMPYTQWRVLILSLYIYQSHCKT